MNFTEQKDAIEACAFRAGYSLKINTNEFVMVFTRDTFGINIYWKRKDLATTRGDNFTVQTWMRHPTRGKTQLNRRGLSCAEVMQIIMKPRKHTGKGYYEK